VADIDAAFVEQIFDLPQRKRIPDIHHHSQADDLGRHLEISEEIARPETLRNPPHRLKPVSSDTALPTFRARFSLQHRGRPYMTTPTTTRRAAAAAILVKETARWSNAT
jgi:hypothetical protein